MIYSINFFLSLSWTFFTSFILFSQNENIPQPKYTLDKKYDGVVRYNDNRIYMNTQQNALKRFCGAMDRLIENRKNKVHIVHFGDSHIQADFFSGQMRMHFNDEKLLGNGGRGYFFPCSMASTSNPYNISVNYKGTWTGCRNVEASKSCSWGLSGMTATTQSTDAQFTIDPNKLSQHKYAITRVKIYYQVNNKSSFYVKIMLPEGAIYPTRLDADGFAEFILPHSQTSITFALEKRFEYQNFFTLEGVSLENDFAGVQYTAVGVNSATVLSFLKTPKFENHMHSLTPDLVVISLGTNDAYTNNFDAMSYKVNLSRLVKRIKNASPLSSILITTPGDCALPGGKINTSNLSAVRMIMEVANEQNCAVWDIFNIMGGLGSVSKWLSLGLSAPDRVHLSGKGYQLQGDLMYDALIIAYGDYVRRKK